MRAFAASLSLVACGREGGCVPAEAWIFDEAAGGLVTVSECRPVHTP